MPLGTSFAKLELALISAYEAAAYAGEQKANNLIRTAVCLRSVAVLVYGILCTKHFRLGILCTKHFRLGILYTKHFRRR